jgi:hypothetical protein
MLDLFNIPTPQTANYQEFYGGTNVNTRTWVKPRGASMVRFLLIGGGGGGANGSSTEGRGGGGSGVVTSWIGPAMFVPDILNVIVGRGGIANTSGIGSYIYYYGVGDFYLLLEANAGSRSNSTTGGAGGSAMTVNQFTASGIFTSIAGQAGTAGSATGAGTNQTASTTTFLSGGAGGAGSNGGTGGSVTPNYGYTVLPATTAGGTVAGANGYFITQPILVGCGGAGGTTSTSVGSAGGRGGIGCGGGGAGEDATNGGGRGGDGAVFIWAW